MSLPWTWPPALPAPDQPVTTDTVENLSTVPGATVTEALDALQTDITTLQGAWIVPAAAPDAWDLEPSQWTDPDINSNGMGWHIQLQGTPHTALTRIGDVDIFNVPGATQYRSTLKGGQLLVQGPDNVLFQIGRSTPATPFTYKARLISSSQTAPVSTKYLFLANLQNSVVGSQNFINGFIQPNLANVVTNQFGGGFTVHVNAAPAVGYGFMADCIFYSDQFDSTTRGYQVCMPTGGSIVERNNLAADRPITVAYGGVWLANKAGQFTAIDFVRRLPYRTFP